MKAAVKVVTSETTSYRNVIPKAMSALVKKRQKDLWSRNTDDELGQRHALVQNRWTSLQLLHQLMGL